jgi:hypothetical protein
MVVVGQLPVKHAVVAVAAREGRTRSASQMVFATALALVAEADVWQAVFPTSYVPPDVADAAADRAELAVAAGKDVLAGTAAVAIGFASVGATETAAAVPTEERGEQRTVLAHEHEFVKHQKRTLA